MNLKFEVDLPKREETTRVNVAELRLRLEELRYNAAEVESRLEALSGTMPDDRLMELKAHLYDLTQAITEKEAEYRRATTPELVQPSIDKSKESVATSLEVSHSNISRLLKMSFWERDRAARLYANAKRIVLEAEDYLKERGEDYSNQQLKAFEIYLLQQVDDIIEQESVGNNTDLK